MIIDDDLDTFMQSLFYVNSLILHIQIDLTNKKTHTLLSSLNENSSTSYYSIYHYVIEYKVNEHERECEINRKSAER